MEAYRRVTGEREWKIKENFDPRGLSEKNWESFYDFFKLFIPELTKVGHRNILLDYRKEYKCRD